MSTGYRPYEPDQQYLLPPSLQEWLPSCHLAHYIGDTVDALDLSAFFMRDQGGLAHRERHAVQSLSINDREYWPS